MPPSWPLLWAALGALLFAQRGPVTVAPRARPPVLGPVARVSVLEGEVERESRGGSWRRESSQFGMAPGERLRTGVDGLALLALPWMNILVGQETVVALAPSAVLATWLERGRIEQRSSSDILKVTTREGVVRGKGSVVVRRTDRGTTVTGVSSLEGTFAVSTGGQVVELATGSGLLLREGQAERVALPAAPVMLRPGRDPAYVKKGEAVRLAWSAPESRFHVEVSSLTGDEVILAREVAGREVPVAVAWPGTFRWRVSAVDESGMEGPPSEAGYFCVVEE